MTCFDYQLSKNVNKADFQTDKLYFVIICVGNFINLILCFDFCIFLNF